MVRFHKTVFLCHFSKIKHKTSPKNGQVETQFVHIQVKLHHKWFTLTIPASLCLFPKCWHKDHQPHPIMPISPRSGTKPTNLTQKCPSRNSICTHSSQTASQMVHSHNTCFPVPFPQVLAQRSPTSHNHGQAESSICSKFPNQTVNHKSLCHLPKCWHIAHYPSTNMAIFNLFLFLFLHQHEPNGLKS